MFLLSFECDNFFVSLSKGFKDLLLIGNQSRPKIFDLEMRKHEKIFEEAVEVDERVRIVHQEELKASFNKIFVEGTTGEKVEILKTLDEEEVEEKLRNLKEKGIESLSIVLLHSYTFRLKWTLHYIQSINKKFSYQIRKLKNITYFNNYLKIR